jgi:hypothetical protein
MGGKTILNHKDLALMEPTLWALSFIFLGTLSFYLPGTLSFISVSKRLAETQRTMMATRGKHLSVFCHHCVLYSRSVTVVTTPCLLAVHVALGYLLGNSSVLREE